MALILLWLLLATVRTAAQSAGHVTRVIQPSTLNRAGKDSTVEPLIPVQWQDEIKTKDDGRTRVVLRDGSILNVGQNSSLKITQHNESSKATQIELAYGYVRANVVSQVQGAGFEVHTSTAVCGVLGTNFEVEGDDEVTQVHVHEGQVNFTHKASGRNMSVNRGQSAHLLHREGRFVQGLHPKFAARARERWKTLKQDTAEELQDRREERQRQVKEAQERRQKDREEKAGKKGGGKKGKGKKK